MNWILWILGALALLMGIVTSYILFLARTSDNPLRKIFTYILLAMMNGMLLGPAFYFSGIGNISITDSVALSAGMMSLEIVYPLILFVRSIEDENINIKISFKLIIFLTILDEFLMSLDFNSFLSSRTIIAQFSSNLPGLFSMTVSSPWFVFPMSLEMALTAIMAIRNEDRRPFIFILLQSIVMFFTPTIISGNLWVSISIFASGVIMTVLLIFMFERLYRDSFVKRRFSSYILEILFIYGIMMIGVMVFQYNSMKILVSIAIIAEMVVYINAILRKNYFHESGKVYWLADKKWSTMFLVDVFIAEFAMGATFDFQYYGTSFFINSLGLTPFSGSIFSMIPEFFYNSIIFVGGITGSPWFLIMMGFEMGSLVVFKIMKTRELENKIRLGLMIVAYGIYSILIPSFIVSNSKIYPFLGWSMGIGTAGGLAPALIIPMLLTYVVSGSLSLLFGARQLCSVFCTAPMMYQGTFYNSMKKFNRTTKTAKYISKGGERNTIYRIASLTVYISLAIAALFSFLYHYHYINYDLYGTDPLAFIYIILFDIMWYAVFLTMPYFGNYGCINTGYCHWGNFNRFVGKHGLFKLKVRDPKQCVTCKTKDCATACPVGLSSQPGSFISDGQFKNSRCVGVGDCVEACPYENIFFYDVRNFLKEKIVKKQD
ncbi:MAG: 4Fe-4S binding protein [Cuniculiplasma sp.]